jgi:hypothetical protein
MAVDAFIKFDGVEGEAVDGRLHRHFRALGADFAGLGGDFIKLIDDLSAQRGASAFKIAQDLKVEHTATSTKSAPAFSSSTAIS